MVSVTAGIICCVIGAYGISQALKRRASQNLFKDKSGLNG